MMAGYLEESAEALRSAYRYAQSVSVMNHNEAQAALCLRVADGFARLAAIERGLLPPEMAPEGLTGTAPQDIADGERA